MGTLRNRQHHFGFAVKHCSTNKPLSDLHSVLILQPLSLKVTKQPAEKEINGNGFCSKEACLGPRSHCQCHPHTLHQSSWEGAKVYKLCLTVRPSQALHLSGTTGPACSLVWLTTVGHFGLYHPLGRGQKGFINSA